MALSFPSSPNVGDVYTTGGKSWAWNGLSWDLSQATQSSSDVRYTAVGQRRVTGDGRVRTVNRRTDAPTLQGMTPSDIVALALATGATPSSVGGTAVAGYTPTGSIYQVLRGDGVPTDTILFPLVFANVISAPTVGTSGQATVFAQGGALKGIGQSGTITTFVNANPHCPVCSSDFCHEWDNPKYGYLAVCMNCYANGTSSSTRIKGSWNVADN